METVVNKTKNGAAETMRKLDEAKRHFHNGNLFSSLVTLSDVLDAFIHIKKIPESDKIRASKAINEFQRRLTTSQEFNDLYGKVHFRENDFATSYDFLCQLIKIKEDEITDVLVNEEAGQLLNLNYLSDEDKKTTSLMVSLVERGELSALRELVTNHDGLGSMVLSFYNETGISHRKSGNIDKAITEYKKALSVSQNDEHLYYNLARAYIEIGQKKNAETSINQALQINPEFQEGLILLKHIKQWSR